MVLMVAHTNATQRSISWQADALCREAEEEAVSTGLESSEVKWCRFTMQQDWLYIYNILYIIDIICTSTQLYIVFPK